MLTRLVTAVLALSFPGILGNPLPAAASPVPSGVWAPQDPPRIEVVAGGGRVSPETLTAVAEEARTAWFRLQDSLRVPSPAPMRIAVHRSLGELPGTLGVSVPEGTPGFAMLLRGEVHLLLQEAGAVPPDDVRTVLSHELVHLLIQQATAPHGDQVPRWFHEGLAQTLAGGTYYGASEEDIYPPLRAGQLPLVISWVNRMPTSPTGRRVAYAASHSFVLWLWDRLGASGVRDLLARVQRGEGWSEAFVAVADTAAATLEVEWRETALRSGLARFLEANCFSILLVLALPLLCLAVYRRIRRDQAVGERMAAEEAVIREWVADADDPSPPADPHR